MPATRVFRLHLVFLCLLGLDFVLRLIDGYTFTFAVALTIELGFCISFFVSLFHINALYSYWKSILVSKLNTVLAVLLACVVECISLGYTFLLALILATVLNGEVKAEGMGYRIRVVSGIMGLPHHQLYEYWYLLERHKGQREEYYENDYRDSKIEGSITDVEFVNNEARVALTKAGSRDTVVFTK